MTLALGVTARAAAVNAITAMIDGGSGPGTIQLRSGPPPASPAVAASGVLLATITCSDPAFATTATETAVIDITPALTVNAAVSGVAGWFRISDSNGVAIIDGTVSTAGNGGDLVLDSTTLTSGLAVTITSGTVTMPQ